jgi:hypothetical protein
MQTYKVEVTRTVQETITIEVKANSAMRACALALGESAWEPSENWAKVKDDEYATKIVAE